MREVIGVRVVRGVEDSPWTLTVNPDDLSSLHIVWYLGINGQRVRLIRDRNSVGTMASNLTS